MSNGSTIDISQIDSDFNEDTEPKDETVLSLLKQAYQGTLLCQHAIIEISHIKPFSNYQPKISEEYRNYFKTAIQQMQLPKLYVYPEDGDFIMSDDYSAFALYKEYKVTQIPCVVLGKVTPADGVSPVGEPFKLPLPTIEQI